MASKEMKALMQEYKEAYLEGIGKPKLYPDGKDFYFYIDGYKIYLPLEFTDAKVFESKAFYNVEPKRKPVQLPIVDKVCKFCEKEYKGLAQSRYCSDSCRKQSLADRYIFE